MLAQVVVALDPLLLLTEGKEADRLVVDSKDQGGHTTQDNAFKGILEIDTIESNKEALFDFKENYFDNLIENVFIYDSE